LQIDERFLEALLHDIFGVLPIAGLCDEPLKNLSLVPFDQQLKRASIPGFRGSNQRCIFLRNQTIG